MVHVTDRSDQKLPWRSPEIVEVGRVDDVTTGNSGPYIEYSKPSLIQITQPTPSRHGADVELDR
jgi:hypothetical protein